MFAASTRGRTPQRHARGMYCRVSPRNAQGVHTAFIERLRRRTDWVRNEDWETLATEQYRVLCDQDPAAVVRLPPEDARGAAMVVTREGYRLALQYSVFGLRVVASCVRCGADVVAPGSTRRETLADDLSVRVNALCGICSGGTL